MERGRLLVIWDDSCTFCRRCIRIAEALDWRRRLQARGSSDDRLLAEIGLTREETDRELKVIENGVMYGGFDAVLRVLAALPLTRFCAWILGFRPLRLLGRRAYTAVAERRRCAAGGSRIRPV